MKKSIIFKSLFLAAIIGMVLCFSGCESKTHKIAGNIYSSNDGTLEFRFYKNGTVDFEYVEVGDKGSIKGNWKQNETEKLIEISFCDGEQIDTLKYEDASMGIYYYDEFCGKK